MKNRKMTRLLVLALALVMLFAVVACDNGGKTEATGENTTAAATTTKAATTAKKTTAKKTTVPAATTTVVTTTQLAKNSVQLVSNFDGDGDGKNETYTFYNYLPEQFAAKNAILIQGKDHLADDIGVTALEQTYGDVKITHYYLNNNEIKDPDGNVIPDANKKLTWKFTVTEAGTYEFCFNMRMKDDAQRGNIITIDGGTPYKMDFKFATTADAAAVRDAVENSYMTGFSAELTAGEHTIQMTINSECPKTFHFRNIYLAKRNEVSFKSTDFLAALPEAFKATSGVITLAGADATGLGIHPLEQGYKADGTATSTAADIATKITHYYLETDANKLAEIKLPDNTAATKGDLYMTWEFTVTTEGDYDVLYNLRLKDKKLRENIMLLDGKEVMYMDYEMTDAEFNGIKGQLDRQNAYLPVGALHLTEGKHTLTMKISDDTDSSFHFRNVYLAKQTPIMVGQFGVANFSSVLPSAFSTNANLIKVECTDLDAGVGELITIAANSNYRLVTREDTGVPSANGAVKLAINGIYHYYLEPMHWENTESWSLYQHYMRWSVTVPEDAWYDVCFNLRLKNQDQRYIQIQIDDAQVKDQYALTYKLSSVDVANEAVRDQSTVGTYLTGWSLYLTKGTHTITARMPDYTKGYTAGSDNSTPSFHFRNIYFIKSADQSGNSSTNPDAGTPDPNAPIDVSLTKDNITTTLPAAFANAIKVPGSACEAGSTIEEKASDKHYLTTETKPTDKGSANGAIKLIAGEAAACAEDGIWHYYLDPKNVLGSNDELSKCYITWTFTLPEAGTYNIASYHRLKADNRGGIITIDDDIVIDFSYVAKGITLADVVDKYAGAYMDWGVSIELEAGTHTITYTDTDTGSVHWRDFYFVKK